MILVKFPTRSRPQKFLSVLKGYTEKAHDNTNITYLITIDSNDLSMTEKVKDEAMKYAPNVVFITGISQSKVHACNRDIHHFLSWDVLILASDDMICQKKGWDVIVEKTMKNKFPDLDGVLYFPDGFTDLNTMCILGKEYYNRFGYIYHPAYKSLWCDNEFQEVAQRLGKEYRSTEILFKHEHPVWSGEKQDQLYQINERFYQEDKRTFEQRKARNFDL